MMEKIDRGAAMYEDEDKFDEGRGPPWWVVIPPLVMALLVLWYAFHS